MKIFLKGRVASKLKSDLATFDEEVRYDHNGDWNDHTINLASLTRAETERLCRILLDSGLQGTKVVAADIKKYLKAEQEGIEKITARTVRQAAWILERYIVGLPHYLVFEEDSDSGSYLGHFVADVDYCLPRREYDREHVVIEFVHIENEVRRKTSESFYAEALLGLTAEEIFKKAGYVAETPTLVAKLKSETEQYYDIRERIGQKFVAKGLGFCDLDDTTEKRGRRSYDRDTVRLDNFGVKTPVVVDVLSEKDSQKGSDDGSDAHVNLYRWHKWNLRYFTPSEDDLARYLEADEISEFNPEIQVPVHPLVPCFDLRRHSRMRIHVNNLQAYVYRKDIAEGLVIPERDRRLVNLLVDQSANTFQDVVEGKGQSMNVLSGGPPGTGKTLTVEVFAEFKERPLYNVQCSQLGLDPETIENNLSIILQRANRWNAVLLLDEADVYIRQRGDDLTHNAIVGVFLRTLEYASCILFMTTNLPDAVDDAIASRCIVRIRYHLPTIEEQTKIWRNLADLNKIPLNDEEIRKFVALHPTISGRDVKNLLKLASFIAETEKRPVDATALEFALEYKPTAAVKDL